MPVLLQARQLTKRYRDVVALDHVDFEIEDTVTGLLGPNGAGKSTAIKLFLGLIEPTEGTAEVLGADAASNVSVRGRLGYMPEHDCLPGSVSAAEFLTHMAGVSGLPPGHARSRAADTLRHVGLFEERYRPIGGYSTGMKQRVKLAQALVHDPVLVLLDEPMAGLDPAGRDEMLDLVRKTHRDFGISVVLSSHIMGDVERTCERILVLDSGRVAQQGQVSAFTGETETLYVEVTDRRAEFVAALHERGVQPELEGSAVVIGGVDGDGYDVIRDALVASGAPLRRLAPRRRALAELFRSDDDGAREEAP
jgi:ABC-2 type transport system ATP-binding protein